VKKEIHKSEERGNSDLGWLHSRFSFSFEDYHNPKRRGFGKLRVFNDDIVEPGSGFGSHPHSNMEIISIPTEGELSHKDSTGAEEVIKPGDVQVMSAGSGVVHSEYNSSTNKQAKFFQLWIETRKQNIKPRHDKKTFKLNKNSLRLVVSGTKNNDSLYIEQNAKVYLGKFNKNKEITYKIATGDGVLVFLIKGILTVEGDRLSERDSIEISETDQITLRTIDNSYFMIVEVPMTT